MFHLLRGVALISALILTSGSATAQAVFSAKFVMPGCRNAITKGIELRYGEGLCMGMISAILYFNDESHGFCAPARSTPAQAIKVVIKYFDERPARMHEDFRQLAIEALRTTWRCTHY